jgi:CRISPR-associated protein Cmr2
MDQWLRDQGVAINQPEPGPLSRPSVPHRFLALVPNALADELIAESKRAAHAKWLEIAGAVRSRLKPRLDRNWPHWDRLWEDQIGSYFDFRAVAFRMKDANHEELLGRDIVDRFTPIKALGDYGDSQPGTWQNSVEISAMLMDASTQIRHIPAYRPKGDVSQKCTLLGTYEQMGPTRFAQSSDFFKEIAQLYPKMYKDSDRLCAISMTKRFAIDSVRFPDTAELCSRSGEGYRYYALLAMDGDNMGRWLSGQKSPRIREVLHAKIIRSHARNGNGPVMDLRRPVSPGLHAAISEALTKFAIDTVPAIVEAHDGVVIYAGGDDVVAALPVAKALQCACELRKAFSSFEALGAGASMSAGLVLAHEMENLRYVLGSARKAEKQSKDRRRDRLTLAVMRRGGEHSFATCRWEYVPTVSEETERFRRGCSDRWTYQLRQQLPALESLPQAAFHTEVRRLLARSEKREMSFLDDLSRFIELHNPPVLSEFVTLCQSASFMTRGRD